jgi:leader peptidase (prepilin peptidase)/N-methyltransferase
VSEVYPAWLLPATWTILGLLVGSFLNVVIHRMPEGLSLIRPGSACPACGRPVRAYDNVPVLSWLLLRGRCRDCGAAISVRYPLVELGTAVLFGLAAWRFAWSPYLMAATLLVACGVALLMIDLDHQRLPFSITGFLAVGLVAALSADGVAGGWTNAPTALLSTLVWSAVYGGVWLVTSGRGMGLGDVALAPVLGLALGWLGWGPSLVALLGGFVVGAVVGVLLVTTGRTGRRRRVPHGPFMLSGAAVGLFAGHALWRGYLGLFGL